jgi:hypothetical protein
MLVNFCGLLGMLLVINDRRRHIHAFPMGLVVIGNRIPRNFLRSPPPETLTRHTDLPRCDMDAALLAIQTHLDERRGEDHL